MHLPHPLFSFLLILLFINCLTYGAETPYQRSYFYVGGRYEDNGEGEHVFKHQMYVEHLKPVNGTKKEVPLIFFPGGGQTGTNYLNKPDGGRGWASYFILQGYECYLVDVPSRGRSPRYPENGTQEARSAEGAQKFWTAPQKYNLWPQAKLHTQWPGSGMMGDEAFDTFFTSTVPSLSSDIRQQEITRDAGVALLDKIGLPAVIFSHSQAGPNTWGIGDAKPELVHAIVALEPSGPPFRDRIISTGPKRAYGLTDIPLNYSPPVRNPDVDLVKHDINPSSTYNCTIQAENPAPRRLSNLAKTAVLVVTAESSYHAVSDWCTVKYMRQAGMLVKHLELEKVGIHGNGHMMFLEKNSDAIAEEILKWLEK